MVLEDAKDYSNLYKKHPVLLYMQDEIMQIPLLQEYVNSSLDNNTVPQSLTSFYSGYFDHFQRHHFKHRSYNDEVQFLMRRTIYAIGRITYKNVMKKIYNKITVASVKKAITTFTLASEENDDSENIPQTTRGILTVDSNNRWCTFCDTLIANYIVARYLAEECVRKFSRGRFKISSTAIRYLTGSALVNGEVGRLLFGILANVREMESLDVRYDDVFRMQCGLFPIIMETCRKGDMRGTQITRLAVDCIYENNNTAKLASFIEDFTKNGVVDYTNACFLPDKLPYSLLTLGYFLGVCPQCYGVEMSNFGLNALNSYYLDLLNNVETDVEYSVVKLNLSKNPVTHKASSRLAAFLNRSSQLSYLDLTDCKLQDIGYVDVANTFSTICLVVLKLSGNMIRDSGLIKSLSNFAYCPLLETLELSNNHLTDASIASFGHILLNLSKLKCLDLSRNSMGNKGLASVAHSMELLPRLSTILLQNNSIGEEGALQLAKSMRRLRVSSIKYINLRNNKISPFGQMELQKLAFSCVKYPQVVVTCQHRVVSRRQPPVRLPQKQQTRMRQAKEFESLTNARRHDSSPSGSSIELRRTYTD